MRTGEGEDKEGMLEVAVVDVVKGVVVPQLTMFLSSSFQEKVKEIPVSSKKKESITGAEYLQVEEEGEAKDVMVDVEDCLHSGYPQPGPGEGIQLSGSSNSDQPQP